MSANLRARFKALPAGTSERIQTTFGQGPQADRGRGGSCSVPTPIRPMARQGLIGRGHAAARPPCSRMRCAQKTQRNLENLLRPLVASDRQSRNGRRQSMSPASCSPSTALSSWTTGNINRLTSKTIAFAAIGARCGCAEARQKFSPTGMRSNTVRRLTRKSIRRNLSYHALRLTTLRRKSE
jgi:hypothetical protein